MFGFGLGLLVGAVLGFVLGIAWMLKKAVRLAKRAKRAIF
jgi:F0F1-type ATP synthase assembly protein I